jgi:hypothetical protein
MFDAGLDLSRKRLDFHLLDAEGGTVDVGASPPYADGLCRLSQQLARHGEPIRAAIESMNGARFVHDRLEPAGWQVEVADAQKVMGTRKLAGYTHPCPRVYQSGERDLRGPLSKQRPRHLGARRSSNPRLHPPIASATSGRKR